MLTTAMDDLVYEMACKYASHYGHAFLRELEKGPISFSDHYEYLAFTRPFFYEILYHEGEFSTFLNERKEQWFSLCLDEEEWVRQTEITETTLLTEVKVRYLYHFSEYYLNLIQKVEEIHLEELEYEREDESYYLHRRYLKEKGDWVESITEKKRLALIEESRKKQHRTIQTLKCLHKTRADIRTYREHHP